MSDSIMSVSEFAANLKRVNDAAGIRMTFPKKVKDELKAMGEQISKQLETDNVNSPSHYQTDNPNGIECIDAIEAALTPDEAAGFRKGNAIKYIWRAGAKGSYREDLEKAAWYLNREIDKSGE